MSCSPYTLSISSQTTPTNHSVSRRGFKGAMRALSISPLHLQKPFSYPIKTQPLNLQKAPNFHSHSSFLRLPISSFPRIFCSQNPNKQRIELNRASLFRSFAERLAILLVGSLLFIGRFSFRPAFALAGAQSSSSAASLEEKMDTQKGKDDEEDMYVKVLEKDPRDVEALKVVVYGKMRKGKLDEAVKYVERLIDLEPDEVEWRLLQALSYELMGQLAKSKKLFKEILEERPLLLRALHGLALVMHKNREGPAVFQMLGKALELARRENRVTEERNIKILIAQMHVVKGDLDRASKQFQELANENPRDFRPYLCQGIIYSLLEKKKEADEQFEIYRSLVPEEFPQRGFIDDVILAAKTESQEQLEKEFESEFSNRR